MKSLADSYQMAHRCWSFDEIVRAIAANLVADRAKASAVALASCSKSLQQPALGEVWRSLCSLAPLVLCFPPKIWKVRENKLASINNGFRRRIIINQIPLALQKSPTPSGMDSISKAVRVEGSIPCSRASKFQDLLKLGCSSYTSALLSW